MPLEDDMMNWVRLSAWSSLFSVGLLHADESVAALSIPQGVLTNAGIPAAFVAQFALFLACVLLWTLACGTLFNTLFHLPAIAGQIIGGILLGPSGIDIGSFAIFEQPLTFIDSMTGSMYALMSYDLFVFTLILISSTLTVSYLLWIAGHETDIRDLVHVGLTASIAGILGALLPIGFTMLGIYSVLHLEYTMMQSIGMGLIFAATSVSIPVAMLVSQKKMHLKTSKATLGAAIIDDVFAVILLSLFFMMIQKYSVNAVTTHHNSLGISLGYMLCTGVIIGLTGYYVVPRLLQWLEEQQYGYLIASVASGLMLLYFAFAELWGGLAGITGAYFIGLFHKMGDKEHHAEEVIAPYVNTFLLPLFLASIGLQLDVSILTPLQWIVVVILLGMAIISKLLSCLIATWVSNRVTDASSEQWTLLESYIFGSSMVARGEVGLVVSTILRSTGLITLEQYTIAVVVIALSTIATPIMLAIGFSMQDQETPKTSDDRGCYSVSLGNFDYIGAPQMFNVIIHILGKSDTYQTTIQLLESCQIMLIEGYEVKIVMCPDRGIMLEGNPEAVKRIIRLIKEGVNKDLQALGQV